MATREENKANLEAADCECGPTGDGGFRYCSGEHFGASFAGVEGWEVRKVEPPASLADTTWTAKGGRNRRA